MSALSAFLFKQKMRRYARGIDRAHELRRRLAYYVATGGFSIGDYSIGDPTVRLFSDSRLIVGKYSSVAAGATFILGGNHRTDFVTTSLLERPSGKRPDPRTFSRGDIVVGSDVWIAANATILSGVTIGDGAVIGAGAVVLDDVPPYGIVLGNPARLVRKRFSDLLIAELLALRWWDLPRERIEQLQPLLHGADVAAFIAECRKHVKAPAQADIPIARMTKQRAAAAASGDEVAALVRRVLPNLSSDDYARPLADIGVDSFAMLTLRLELEQLMHGAIPDQSWLAAATLHDVFGLAAQARDTRAPGAPAEPAAARRSLTLNMPQMAQGGLSESWLFKEAGDIHWELIQKGLHAPSSQLADSEGNRLYATFTRIRLEADAPLRAYRENEPVEIEARMARYGAGMFFSEVSLQGEGKTVRMKLMSSFSKRGDADENTSLLRGQPPIPPDCEIPAFAALPHFAQAYRARRGAALEPPIFETEYEIVPAHDINGVGLLYFAAYPIIKDICATRYAGRAALANMSTSARDIFYLANCNPDETLVYRIHRWQAEGDAIAIEESLSRKSDGAPMSYAVTRKQAGAVEVAV